MKMTPLYDLSSLPSTLSTITPTLPGRKKEELIEEKDSDSLGTISDLDTAGVEREGKHYKLSHFSWFSTYFVFEKLRFPCFCTQDPVTHPPLT